MLCHKSTASVEFLHLFTAAGEGAERLYFTGLQPGVFLPAPGLQEVSKQRVTVLGSQDGFPTVGPQQTSQANAIAHHCKIGFCQGYRLEFEFSPVDQHLAIEGISAPLLGLHAEIVPDQ